MLALLLVLAAFTRLSADVQPVLGNSFTFPQNCTNDEEGKLLRAEPHGEVDVAVRPPARCVDTRPGLPRPDLSKLVHFVQAHILQ